MNIVPVVEGGRLAQVRKGGKPSIADAPEPIDALVSKRLRQRRQFLEISQQAMADHLGVSRSQYVKYETAENRLTAAKIYECARILDVGVEYFFDAKASQLQIPENLTVEERKVLEAYRSLPDAMKPRARTLLRTLAA